MKQRSTVRGVSAACLLAVPLALSGCGLFGSESSGAIDPPPAEVEAQMLSYADGGQMLLPDQAAVVTETGETPELAAANTAPQGPLTTVFLQDGSGLLAPVAVPLPEAKGTDAMEQALEALVADGPYQSSLPSGFSGVLPKGTEVKAVTMDEAEGLAVVELGGAFSTYRAGDERKILEALTWTLTGQEGVRQVQLWENGKKLTEMPVNQTPLASGPLNRSLGINLTQSGGPHDMNAGAVTVYFSAATPGGLQYYVPITRFVDSGKDRLTAAINELIEGPEAGEPLEQVMTSGTTLKSVQKEDGGIVSVALDDEMFEGSGKVPAELLKSVVLTVAGNTDGERPLVKVSLNGGETTGTDNVNYSKPVSAPEAVNQFPM